MTDWPALVQLAVIAAAAARVTNLLVDDAILDLPRGLLHARLLERPMLLTLVSCHRCLGWWVTVLWLAAWWASPVVATALAVPWAVALLAWWLGGSWLPDREEP